MSENIGAPLQAEIILDDSQFTSKLADVEEQAEKTAGTIDSTATPAVKNLSTEMDVGTVSAKAITEGLMIVAGAVAAAVTGIVVLTTRTARRGNP